MIYRGSGFLAVVWFGSSRIPLPLAPASKRDRWHTGRLRKREKMLIEEGRGGGRATESYDRKKAFSYINPSILSGFIYHPPDGFLTCRSWSLIPTSWSLQERSPSPTWGSQCWSPHFLFICKNVLFTLFFLPLFFEVQSAQYCILHAL